MPQITFVPQKHFLPIFRLITPFCGTRVTHVPLGGFSFVCFVSFYHSPCLLKCVPPPCGACLVFYTLYVQMCFCFSARFRSCVIILLCVCVVVRFHFFAVSLFYFVSFPFDPLIVIVSFLFFCVALLAVLLVTLQRYGHCLGKTSG